MSPSKSSTLLVFVGIATIVSRLISGRLCDVSFIKPRYVQQAGVILSGISTILLTFAVNYTHLIIFSLFYGIADGAFRVSVNILFMNTVDIPRKPSAFGQANMIMSVSSAAGPALAGKLIK
jgi:MFS family permease